MSDAATAGRRQRQRRRTRDRTATSIINKIVAGSLRQRFLILFFTVLLIFGGIYSFRRLPVDAYPDLSPPRSRS